jgi:hypothetical protein
MDIDCSARGAAFCTGFGLPRCRMVKKGRVRIAIVLYFALIILRGFVGEHVRTCRPR